MSEWQNLSINFYVAGEKELIMSENIITDSGSVKISENVISTIVSNVAVEVAGVAEISAGNSVGIKSLIGKKGASCIKIEFQGEDIIIDISIIAKYGAKIQEVAAKLQDVIMDSVTSMTGINVIKVNVLIAGIAMPKDEA